jgi:hypothetical protein
MSEELQAMLDRARELRTKFGPDCALTNVPISVGEVIAVLESVSELEQELRSRDDFIEQLGEGYEELKKRAELMKADARYYQQLANDRFEEIQKLLDRKSE